MLFTVSVGRDSVSEGKHRENEKQTTLETTPHLGPQPEATTFSVVLSGKLKATLSEDLDERRIVQVLIKQSNQCFLYTTPVYF